MWGAVSLHRRMINTMEDHSTTPDVLVKMDEPYPFEDDTFDAIYLGHVLEHIAWPKLGVFLTDMVRTLSRVLRSLLSGLMFISALSDGLKNWSLGTWLSHHGASG